MPCSGVDRRAVPVRGVEECLLLERVLRRRRALLQRGHGVPVIRSAASRPLISTIGTPTPGWTTTRRARRSPDRSGAAWRAGTGRSGRMCAPGRTGCPRPCPARPSPAAWPAPRPRSASVTPGPAARLQGGQHLVAVAGAEARPVQVGVAAAVPVEVGRGGHDAEHLTRLRAPATGRCTDGMLISRLGSVMGLPSRVSSSKTCRQAAPKLIVWWACPGSVVRTPRCSATQEGDQTGRRGARSPGTSCQGWSAVTTTASAGSRSPSTRPDGGDPGAGHLELGDRSLVPERRPRRRPRRRPAPGGRRRSRPSGARRRRRCRAGRSRRRRRWP